MSNLYESPELPDGVTWRDEPVVHHGGRHVWPGRRVVEVSDRPWPVVRPEDCDDDSERGEWLFEGTVLVCPRCGLDCT